MGYEINVSLHGRHYFATHERSIGTDQEKLKALLVKFNMCFPASEGWHITATAWQKIGTSVPLEKLIG